MVGKFVFFCQLKTASFGCLFHFQPAQSHGQILPPLWEAEPKIPIPIIYPPTAPVRHIVFPCQGPSTTSRDTDSVHVCDNSGDAQEDENHHPQTVTLIVVVLCS